MKPICVTLDPPLVAEATEYLDRTGEESRSLLIRRALREYLDARRPDASQLGLDDKASRQPVLPPEVVGRLELLDDIEAAFRKHRNGGRA